MSYVVHVWEYPVPRNEGEADGIVEALDGYPGNSQARFLELGRRLTARYPDWGDDPGTPAVWIDSPMAEGCDSAVWNIGVVTDHLDTAAPFLFDCVRELKLCLYDPQSGELVRPHPLYWSPVFEEHDRRLGTRWGGLDVALAEQVVADRLAPALRLAGFHRVGYQFLRAIGDGWQCIRHGLFAQEDGVPQLVIWAGVHLRTAIDAMRKGSQDFVPNEAWGGGGFAVNDCGPSWQALRVRSMVELTRAVDTLLPVLTGKALTMLDRARTLQGLHDLLADQRAHGGIPTDPQELAFLQDLCRFGPIAGSEHAWGRPPR